MKERRKFHVADIINLVVFYSVLACFLLFLVFGTIDFAKGELQLSRYIYRYALTLLMFVPFAIKKLFKITFSTIASGVYYIYLFLSGFLGVVVNLYAKTAAWDVFIHFLMGAVISVLSIYILNLTVYKKDRSKHNLFFTFVFMIFFSMGVEAIWEIWEFTGDVIFGLNSQRYLTETGTMLFGQKALWDTMIDICMNFIGSIAGVAFMGILILLYPKILKTFTITKLKHKEPEVEDIEE